MSMTSTAEMVQRMGRIVVVECHVCGDPIFEHRPCPRCVELEKLFEAKRKADAERMKLLGRLPERVDMGVVPHAPPPVALSMGSFLVVAGAGLSLSVLAGVGCFYALKWAIGFCLRP